MERGDRRITLTVKPLMYSDTWRPEKLIDNLEKRKNKLEEDDES